MSYRLNSLMGLYKGVILWTTIGAIKRDMGAQTIAICFVSFLRLALGSVDFLASRLFSRVAISTLGHCIPVSFELLSCSRW